MYLELAGNIAPMGDDRVNRDIKLFSDFLIGHALDNAGDDFSLTLAERIGVGFVLPRGMKELANLAINGFFVVIKADGVVILTEQILVDHAAKEGDAFHIG